VGVRRSVADFLGRLFETAMLFELSEVGLVFKRFHWDTLGFLWQKMLDFLLEFLITPRFIKPSCFL
jgi:hypothetical protein